MASDSIKVAYIDYTRSFPPKLQKLVGSLRMNSLAYMDLHRPYYGTGTVVF